MAGGVKGWPKGADEMEHDLRTPWVMVIDDIMEELGLV